MSWQELGNDKPGVTKKRLKINLSKSTQSLTYSKGVFIKFRKNIDCSHIDCME